MRDPDLHPGDGRQPHTHLRHVQSRRHVLQHWYSVEPNYRNPTFRAGVERAGIDYPADVKQWPTAYVPVPIHTELRGKDFVSFPRGTQIRSNGLL